MAVDWTTWTEDDPNGHIEVAAKQLNVNAMHRDEDARVYNDYGAGFFGSEFIHTFGLYITSASNGIAVCWAVSNYVDDGDDWDDNNREAIMLKIQYNGVITLESTENNDSDSYNGSLATQYNIEVERPNDDFCLCRIYDDGDPRTLLDTLSVALPVSVRSYRYAFGCNSWDDNFSSYWITFIVTDLDLGLGGAVPVFDHHYKMAGGL
jgi:hypothetical protein